MQLTSTGTDADASAISSIVNWIFARRAIASKWTIALVEPPIAPSTVAAFIKDCLVRILSGVRLSMTAWTIARPP